MELSKLTQKVLDDAVCIYYSYAYEKKVDLSKKRIFLDEVKRELRKYHRYEKALGNKRDWKLMKLLVTLNHGSIEFIVDPHHTIYDHMVPKELKEYNYGLKNLIERKWEKKHIPVKTYFERREEVREGISK